jgi:hypothetical protein
MSDRCRLIARIQRLHTQRQTAVERHQATVRRVTACLARSKTVSYENRRLLTLRAFAMKLTDGRLPMTRPAMVNAQPGTGGRCDGCDRRLLRSHLAIEVPRTDGTLVYLHADCFMIWDDLRRSVAAQTV